MWVGATLNAYLTKRDAEMALFLFRYFLWDALDAIINFIDAGFVAHGIACFAIFFLSYVRVSSNSFSFP